MDRAGDRIFRDARAGHEVTRGEVRTAVALRRDDQTRPTQPRQVRQVGLEGAKGLGAVQNGKEVFEIAEDPGWRGGETAGGLGRQGVKGFGGRQGRSSR